MAVDPRTPVIIGVGQFLDRERTPPGDGAHRPDGRGAAGGRARHRRARGPGRRRRGGRGAHGLVALPGPRGTGGGVDGRDRRTDLVPGHGRQHAPDAGQPTGLRHRRRAGRPGACVCGGEAVPPTGGGQAGRDAAALDQAGRRRGGHLARGRQLRAGPPGGDRPGASSCRPSPTRCSRTRSGTPPGAPSTSTSPRSASCGPGSPAWPPTNPYAWRRDAYTAAEITTPTPDNRMVGFPYTKRMVSNPDVDMAAGCIVCSVERAAVAGRAPGPLGVPPRRHRRPGPAS